MKKAIKFSHTMGALGLTGALLAHLFLLISAPDPYQDLNGYHAVRVAIDTIARFLLLPSLTLVLISGLSSLAIHPPFRDQRWVWAKVLLGLSIFEGTLVSVQGPAQRGAALTGRAMTGEIDITQMLQMMHDERGAIYVVLCVAIANVVLATWRPRLKPSRAADTTSVSR
jgi:hypothetical protein